MAPAITNAVQPRSCSWHYRPEWRASCLVSICLLGQAETSSGNLQHCRAFKTSKRRERAATYSSDARINEKPVAPCHGLCRMYGTAADCLVGLKHRMAPSAPQRPFAAASVNIACAGLGDTLFFSGAPLIAGFRMARRFVPIQEIMALPA